MSVPDELSVVAFHQDGSSLGISDLALEEGERPALLHRLRLNFNQLTQLGSLISIGVKSWSQTILSPSCRSCACQQTHQANHPHWSSRLQLLQNPPVGFQLKKNLTNGQQFGYIKAQLS